MRDGEPDKFTQARRKAERKGHLAERFAALALRLKGYRVLESRFRTKAGEIDLIICKGDVIAFVEVKARAGELQAVDSVSGATQARIRAAGDVWIARSLRSRADFSRYSFRYDIVAILPHRWPLHFPGAF